MAFSTQWSFDIESMELYRAIPNYLGSSLL